MSIQFRPLSQDEVAKLSNALRGNAVEGKPLHMDPLTTGWRPGEDEVSDKEVINAIQSVPTHY